MLRRTFDKSRKIQNRRDGQISIQGKQPSTILTRKQSNKVEADIYNDGVFDERRGQEVTGTVAECTKCGHKTQSFGTSDGSKKRCLVLLKVECPKGESNFYVEKEKVFDCSSCGKSAPVSHWDGPDMNICPSCGHDIVPF